MSAQGTIVVGVDGSDCSRAALEFALDEAARRNAGVRVVAAAPEADYWATSQQAMVDELTERGCSVAGIPVSVQGVAGAPGRVLVEQSRDADLLVVGHRGRGGFRSAALGSVSLQCVLHASVPVTVVRPRQQPDTAGSGA